MSILIPNVVNVLYQSCLPGWAKMIPTPHVCLMLIQRTSAFTAGLLPDKQQTRWEQSRTGSVADTVFLLELVFSSSSGIYIQLDNSTNAKMVSNEL